MKVMTFILLIAFLTLGEECANGGDHMDRLDQISNRSLCKDISGSFFSDGISDWPKENSHRTLLNTIKYTLPKNLTGIDWNLLNKSRSFMLKISNNILELSFTNAKEVKINSEAICTSGEWRTETKSKNRIEGGHAYSYYVNSYLVDEHGNLVVRSFNSSVTKSVPPFSYKHRSAAITKFAHVE